MTTEKTFTIGSRHSEKDIEAESRAMLGRGVLPLTLGRLMLLHLEHSPYVRGGEVTDYDVGIAASIVPRPRRMKDDAFHDALCGEIATAWRAMEIVSPQQDAHGGGRQSKVDLFSPEWLSDTIGMACAAMPSLTMRQVLWEAPLALVLHLAISTARRNGTITERPADIMAALQQLKAMGEKENGENNA